MPRFLRYGLITTLLIVVVGIASYPTLLRLTAAQILKSFDYELVEVEALSLNIDETTSIQASGLIITGAGADLEIGRLNIALVTNSLLPGKTVELKTLSVANWKLQLHDKADGEDRALEQREAFSLEDLQNSLDALLVEFSHPIARLDLIELLQGKLLYLDQDQDIDLDLDELTLQGGSTELSLSVKGLLNGTPLRLGGRLGRENDLTTLIGTGQWQQYKLSIDAQVAQLVPLTHLKSELLLTAPEAKPLLELLGAHEVRNGALQVRANVTGANDQINSLSNIMIGDLKLRGELQYQMQTQDFALDYFAAGPSLQEAGALLDYMEYLNEPFEATGRLTRHGNSLELADGKIRLGPGEFRAAGVLPNFPEITDWQLDIGAERFDLSVLQPFIPCRLPEIDLTWVGRLSTNPQGQEFAELNLRDDGGLYLSTSAVLGVEPDYQGTAVTFEFNQLLANPFTECAGVELVAPLVVSGQGIVSKQAGSWQIETLNLNSELANLTARPLSANQLEISLDSHDISQLLAIIPNTPEFFAPNPVALTASLGFSPDTFDFKTTEFALGSSKGDLSLGRNQAGSLTAQASLEGDDLVSLVHDTPFNSASMTKSKLPFTAQLSSQLNEENSLTSEIDLAFADNTLNIATQFDLDEPLDSPVVNISGQGPSIEVMFGPFVDHALPDHPFEIAFSLKQNDAQLEVEQLFLDIGPHKLSGSLMFDALPNVERTSGQLQLESPSSMQLLGLFGFTPDIIDAPVQITASLDGTRDMITAELTSASIGDSDLTGQVKIRPGDIPEVSVDLVSSYIHLPTFLPSLETATDDTKDAVVRGKKVIPEVQLPWRLLKNIALNFRWDLQDVLLKQDQKSKAKVEFSIEDGRLNSQDISWTSDLNNGKVILLVDTRDQPDDFGQFRLEVISERIPVMWLYTGVPTISDGGKLSFHAKLNSFGKTATDLGANLDGAILFRGGSGQINSSKLDTLFGDFLFQLSNMAFGTGDQQTKISCTAGAFYIRGGKINMDPGLAVRTSRFDILSSGLITLPDEKLKLSVSSRSRQGIGVSAASTLVPNVGISGILSKPQINVNARDTAISGGAAIATSGLSILATGIWDRIRSSVENPCDALVDKARKDGGQYFSGLN